MLSPIGVELIPWRIADCFERPYGSNELVITLPSANVIHFSLETKTYSFASLKINKQNKTKQFAISLEKAYRSSETKAN